jgi:hypothetical protein
MPQLRGGQQLRPVGLATVICQLSVLLGLGLLISADSLGPCRPELSSLHLLNVTVDALHGLDGRRKFSILGPSGPSSQLTAVVGTYAYVSSWTSDLQLHPLSASGGTAVEPSGISITSMYLFCTVTAEAEQGI